MILKGFEAKRGEGFKEILKPTELRLKNNQYIECALMV
jgi:hypothetical protein